MEQAKSQKFKCDILGDFQTLWSCVIVILVRKLEDDGGHIWCSSSSHTCIVRNVKIFSFEDLLKTKKLQTPEGLAICFEVCIIAL